MTIYNVLGGLSGVIFTSASGGSLSTQTIGSEIFNVHRYTGNGSFTVSIAGTTPTVDVQMWGAGGGNGGRSRRGGGGAYARSSSFTVAAGSNYNIYIPGGGGDGNGGCIQGGGAGGGSGYGSGGKGWGAASGQTQTEAQVAAYILQRDFGMTFSLSDGESRDTRENALRSYALLSAQGITRIALVTHDWHMQRSLEQFEAAGFEVIPAPMGYTQPPMRWDTDYLPSANGLRASNRVLHEWLGRLHY